MPTFNLQNSVYILDWNSGFRRVLLWPVNDVTSFGQGIKLYICCVRYIDILYWFMAQLHCNC